MLIALYVFGLVLPAVFGWTHYVRRLRLGGAREQPTAKCFALLFFLVLVAPAPFYFVKGDYTPRRAHPTTYKVTYFADTQTNTNKHIADWIVEASGQEGAFGPLLAAVPSGQRALIPVGDGMQLVDVASWEEGRGYTKYWTAEEFKPWR